MPQNDNPTSGNPYVKAFHDLMATSKDFTQFLADPAERQGIRQGFTDAVNRGAVAATLGAPVDMANMGLNLGKAAVGYLGNKAGVLSADQMPQLIDNPVGGSEYIGNQLQRFGMVSPNRNALAEGLAGVLPTSPVKSAKAVAAIAGGGVVPGMDLAATVFHGSPHKFDRFDSSKIGTGEGAQAYGHGLYLAEAPDVAQAYANKLTQVDGRAISDQLDSRVRYLNMLKQQASAGDVNAAKNVPVIEKSIAELQNQGSLYKVDLPDEAIAKMLDWDKPLSQQAPEVQKALQMSGVSIPDMAAVDRAKASADAAFDAWIASQRGGSSLESNKLKQAWKDAQVAHDKAKAGISRTGADAYKDLQYQNRDWAIEAGRPAMTTQAAIQAKASEDLRAFGIPGIRYLDGGSRSAGQGSSNYVVFPGNENMLRILERNGQVLK